MHQNIDVLFCSTLSIHQWINRFELTENSSGMSKKTPRKMYFPWCFLRVKTNDAMLKQVYCFKNESSFFSAFSAAAFSALPSSAN